MRTIFADLCRKSVLYVQSSAFDTATALFKRSIYLLVERIHKTIVHDPGCGPIAVIAVKHVEEKALEVLAPTFHKAFASRSNLSPFSGSTPACA